MGLMGVPKSCHESIPLHQFSIQDEGTRSDRTHIALKDIQQRDVARIESSDQCSSHRPIFRREIRAEAIHLEKLACLVVWYHAGVVCVLGPRWSTLVLNIAPNSLL
jgi:hypothetical protein